MSKRLRVLNAHAKQARSLSYTKRATADRAGHMRAVPVTVDADSVTGTFAVNCVINGGGAVAEVSAIDMFADS